MMGACIAFMKDKKAKQIEVRSGMELPADYTRFYETFSKMDAKSIVPSAAGMIVSTRGRHQLGRFLIKSLCDQYQGNYNPHYLTGLASALWVVQRYWSQTPIALNALFQYLSFFFEGIT
jgi:hypothetical protein